LLVNFYQNDKPVLKEKTVAKSNIHYWLALKLIPRLAAHKKLAIVQKVGLVNLFERTTSLENFSLTATQMSAINQPNWQKIEQIIQHSQTCNSVIIPHDHQHYPHLLKEIYDPPLVIFVQGDTDILTQMQIAMVGSRSATISAREQAMHFAGQLVEEGLVITSGLAIGIDGFAHQGAINAKGKTIAVVATGLDSVYPSRHKQLVSSILASGGVIMSEFPPGTLAKQGHFPKRNRIISGMSVGVLVVEAALKSGSLITARTALEQDREVFAIPGSIANTQAKGCNWLIKQGAKLVDEVADITNELDVSSLSSVMIKAEKKVENIVEQDLFIDSLLASVGDETTPIDVVVSRSKLPVDEVLGRLVLLELRGLISSVPGGYQKLSKG
jgi:DNA processing protein